jgi:hypothetical protein
MRDPLYLVLYYGDLEMGKERWTGSGRNVTPWEADHKSFRSLDDALAAIAKDFPIVHDYASGEGIGEPYRESPDPEDDRIVVWEIAEGKTMKAVWHFSGWHWSGEELGIPQGSLPGDQASLYEIANG